MRRWLARYAVAGTTAAPVAPFRRCSARATGGIPKPVVIRVGSSAVLKHKMTLADFAVFGDLVKDFNSIHREEASARQAGFPRPIGPGMYAAALFSGIMGSTLPGEGSVYLHQTLDFLAPVFDGDEVEARVVVEQFKKSSGLILLRTTVTRTDPNSGERIVCVDGHSLGRNKIVTFEGESPWTYVRRSR